MQLKLSTISVSENTLISHFEELGQSLICFNESFWSLITI